MLDDRKNKRVHKDSGGRGFFGRRYWSDRAEGGCSLHHRRARWLPGNTAGGASVRSSGPAPQGYRPIGRGCAWTSFIAKFPNSQYLPQLGMRSDPAQNSLTKRRAAGPFKDMAAKFPRARRLPFSFDAEDIAATKVRPVISSCARSSPISQRLEFFQLRLSHRSRQPDKGWTRSPLTMSCGKKRRKTQSQPRHF